MTVTAGPDRAGASDAPPRLPPVTAVCIASMGLVVAGGIYLAAHLPHVPPLGPAVGLVVAGAAALVAAVVLLARVRRFAWGRFFSVARYVLLAYGVIAGVLVFVFVDDGTRGGPLAVLVASLAVFAVDVPVILAFTVARYEKPTGPLRPEPAA